MQIGRKEKDGEAVPGQYELLKGAIDDKDWTWQGIHTAAAQHFAQNTQNENLGIRVEKNGAQRVIFGSKQKPTECEVIVNLVSGSITIATYGKLSQQTKDLEEAISEIEDKETALELQTELVTAVSDAVNSAIGKPLQEKTQMEELSIAAEQDTWKLFNAQATLLTLGMKKNFPKNFLDITGLPGKIDPTTMEKFITDQVESSRNATRQEFNDAETPETKHQEIIAKNKEFSVKEGSTWAQQIEQYHKTDCSLCK